MIETSLKILKKQKRYVVAIVVVTFVFLLISTLSVLTADEICATRKKQAISNYGSFIVGGVVNSQTEYPHTSNLKIGKCRIIDYYRDKGITYPIGVADIKFRELSSISLVEGEYPQQKNEIAMQAFAAKALGGYKLGDKVQITINGDKEEYKLSGLTNNYSMTLSSNIENPSQYSYPVIFMSEKVTKKSKYYPYLIGFNNPNSIGFNQDNELKRVSNNIKDENIIQYTNDNLFTEGFEQCAELWYIALIYSVLVFILMIFLNKTIYKIMYKDSKKQIAIFETLGANVKMIMKALLMQFFLLEVISLGLSMLALFFITYFFPGLNHHQMTRGCVLLASFSLVGCLVFAFYIVRDVTEINLQGIKNNLISTTDFDTVKKNIENRVTKLFKFNILGSVKYFIIFIIVFVSIYLILENQSSLAGIPDYELIAQDIEISEVINGFEIKENNDSYNTHQVNDFIKKYKKANFVLEPELNNNTLIIDRHYKNDFLNNWNKSNVNYDTDVEDSTLKRRMSSFLNEYYTLNNVEYIIVSDGEYKRIINNKKIESNSVLMYIPTELDLNKERKNFQFGKLYTKEKPVYKIHRLEVQKVLNKKDRDKIRNNSKKYADKNFDEDTITFIINKKDIEKNPIVDGYKSIQVYTESMPLEQAMDDEIKNIQSEVQGGKLYSKHVRLEKEKQYYLYTKILSGILLLISLIIVFVYQICNILFHIRNNKKLIGIIMTVGGSKKSYIINKLLEYLGQSIIAILFATFVIFLIIYNESNGAKILQYIAFSSIVTISSTVLEIGMLYFYLSKTDIKELLYKVQL